MADTGPVDAGPMMSSCADLEDRADAFLDANQSCSVATDCTTVSAPCYSGQQDCCVIYLRSDYDMAAWTEIHDGLMSCAGKTGCGCCAAIPAAPACIAGTCAPATAETM